MIGWITEPWSSQLVARSGLALLLVSVIGGVVGVFVLLRGLAFTTEAFAHTAFPGAVLAAAAGGSVLVGGLIATVVAAAAIALAARGDRTTDETATSVVYTGLFALGAILLTTLGPLDRDVTSFLFGSLLGVSGADLIAIALIGLLVGAALWIIRRPLIATAFDRDIAIAGGARAGRLDGVLLIVLAVSVVVLVQAVGNMLVVAMLITPAATARLLTRRIAPTVLLSVAIALVTSLIGLYVSYYATLATGATVVLTGTVLLALSAIARRGMPHTGRGT